MRIRYLGTAAAEGFPAVFCNCAACKMARELGELRTRSQALIDETLLVDLPPETYYHTVRFGIDLSAVSHLLVTHSHTDHFYAQELVNRGYKFAYGMRAKTLRIYGDETVREVFAEGTAREIKDDVRRYPLYNGGTFYGFRLRRIRSVRASRKAYAFRARARLFYPQGRKGNIVSQRYGSARRGFV